jgi:hypothetical protein
MATSHQDAIVASTWSEPSGTAHAGLARTTGEPIVDTVLPARGHGMCLSPDGGTAVVFARRPGRFAVVIDLEGREPVRRIDSEPGRHFYGHGVFSGDGGRLFATENDYEGGVGRIGIYDAGAGFRRHGEWPSHGIEPHEILLMPDGRRLAVANGGILTHPSSGRDKLNLATMRSSVVLLDAASGDLVATAAPPPDLHRLSLRHLAAGPDGRLAVAIQYQGDATDQVPLLATWDGRGDLRLVDDGEAVLAAMRNYCGSVAVDATGELIALTSAPGSLATFWRAADLKLVASRHMPDVCGVAATAEPGRFVLSSGTGGLWTYDATADELSALAATQRLWDNHMSCIIT